jgi:hypothetical protein
MKGPLPVAPPELDDAVPELEELDVLLDELELLDEPPPEPPPPPQPVRVTSAMRPKSRPGKKGRFTMPGSSLRLNSKFSLIFRQFLIKTKKTGLRMSLFDLLGFVPHPNLHHREFPL